jgi:putative SOS response-associated peptidase YedK
MCSHYQAPQTAERYRAFGVIPPPTPAKQEMWPGYAGCFIRAHPQAQVGDEAVPALEAVNGLFGLVPHWASDTKLAQQTYNARTETVATKASYRDAWSKAQHCIIPAEAIYEPDWRSGRAIDTRIERSDVEPMGIAGIWSSWKSPKGEVFSYTMLTINADHHPLMNQFHKPTDEKRMVVILPQERYQEWINASVQESMDFMQHYPADQLRTIAPPQRQAILF